MEIGRWGDGTDGEMGKSLWARPWGQKQVCQEHPVSETLGRKTFCFQFVRFDFWLEGAQTVELNICRFQEWLPGSSDALAKCDQRRVGHSGQQCIIVPVCCPEASHASIIVLPAKTNLEAALPEAATEPNLVRKREKT